ncbi:MAG: hypothetical protein LBJ23_06765 [Tannerella sp.]|jgi:hypothetical protein|nr:hypothetical protein [Tannerella sp.]
MILFGLILTALSGICIALCISRKLKLIEILGLAFPLGMGAQTFLMVCLDWAGVKLTAWSVISVTLVLLAATCAYLFTRREKLKEWYGYVSTFTYPKLSWAWLLCVAAIAAVMVMNLAKTMYFPTFDTDSVRGYDLIGMAAGHEGTLKSLSLFTDANYSLRGAASYMSYPPFSQLAYAYVYMLGAATSKIVNALIFVSFVFTFYGISSRFATHLLAALTTLFVIATPEMLGFSSMSGLNFTHAMFASFGILYFVTWYYKKIPSFLWLSAAMLMLNVWTRSEGPAYVAATCCILLWYAIRNRRYRQFALYALLCAFPFVFYTLFLKVHHLESESVLITKPFWDGTKLRSILAEEWALLKDTSYYGFTFIACLIAMIAGAWHMYRRKDHVVTALLLLLSILFCTALIYQLRLVWDSLEAIMRYSYKRLIFSFVPIAWFYVAANLNVKRIFEKIDDFMFPCKNRQ